VRVLQHLTRGPRKLFWLLAVLALVADLATKEWLHTPATARAQVVRRAGPDQPAVTDVTVADVDGDGAEDVLLAEAGRVVCLAVEGSEAPRPLAGPVPGLTHVDAADLDGDGDADLLLAGDQIWWSENRTGLEFGDPVALHSSDGARAACAADLDGDGDADVVATLDQLVWYESAPGASWARRRVLAGDVGDVADLEATDMDGDGDADPVLLVDGAIVWYENQGGSRLGAGARLRGRRPIRAFHPADLDGDGDADLLVAADRLRWYENLGGGQFQPGEAVAPARDVVGLVATGDLDRDGDVDAVVVSEGRLAWYENTPRRHITIIPGLLDIVPHDGNTQGAFGLGPRNPTFFVGAAVVGLCIIGVLLWRTPPARWHVHTALGLLAGGALGNVYDRLTLGAVRDFIDLHWRGWHWPTFNIADVAICAGFFIILLDSFLAAPAEDNAEAEPDADVAPAGDA
jgi:lipoprotein signal peptidase